MKLIDKRNLISAILMVLLAITGCSVSQHEEQPPSVEDIIARMKHDLNLSDEQVIQITPIMQDDMRQRREIRSQGLDEDTVKTQIQAVRESTRSKLSQYLTEDQSEQWRKMRRPPLRFPRKK